MLYVIVRHSRHARKTYRAGGLRYCAPARNSSRCSAAMRNNLDYRRHHRDARRSDRIVGSTGTTHSSAARSRSTMSERSCTRSKTTSRPSGEMSKSRISKSSGRLVNCRSAPVSRSISQRSLCSIPPRRKASPRPPERNLRCRAPRVKVDQSAEADARHPRASRPSLKTSCRCRVPSRQRSDRRAAMPDLSE